MRDTFRLFFVSVLNVEFRKSGSMPVRVSVIGLAMAALVLVFFLLPLRGQPALPTVRFIGFSTQLAPGDRLECRQAVAYALDREAVARAVAPHIRQTPRAAANFQHPALPGFDSGIRGYAYDPARAKELFGQCGFLGAFRILVGPSTSRFLEVYNEAVADSLRKALGVQVEWNRVSSFSVLVQAAKAGSAPVWMFAWGAEPRDFGYPSIAMGIANELVSDPEVKLLVQKGDARAVEEMILQKALVVPVIYY
jgi:ABC-type transport system substrate-binding protein